MDRPILVATDGSPGSAGALRFAFALGEARHQPVEVLTVAEPLPIYGFDPLGSVPAGYPLLQHGLEEDLLNAVKEQVRKLEGKEDWPVKVTVGSPAFSIAEEARLSDAELIVVGSGPHGLMDRWLRSEVSLKVVQLANVPVVLVPELSGNLPMSGLAGVDFSEFSLHAARALVSLLRPGGRLHLTHIVWTPNEAESLPSLREYWKTYRAGAAARLEQFAEELRASDGVSVETSVTSGDPAHELLALAERLQTDIIAAGRHGYGFVDRLMMGSVSTKVMRGARAMVLVAPPVSQAKQTRSANSATAGAALAVV
jgi:nucleotide-binding universal stress UspA family protein